MLSSSASLDRLQARPLETIHGQGVGDRHDRGHFLLQVQNVRGVLLQYRVVVVLVLVQSLHSHAQVGLAQVFLSLR